MAVLVVARGMMATFAVVWCDIDAWCGGGDSDLWWRGGEKLRCSSSVMVWFMCILLTLRKNKEH